MNSTNTHKSKRFSRSDMDEIQQNQSVGRHSADDDFERDALEGWSKASENTRLMSGLDKRFNPQRPLVFWMISIISLLVIGFFTFTNSSTNGKIAPTGTSQKLITVDQRDVLLPKSIANMEKLPKDLQINPEKVVTQFQQKEESYKNQQATRVEFEEEFTLPTRKIQPSSTSPTFSIAKKKAKEIYLMEFKLIDYRAYRSKPELTTKQMTILSGTSAGNGIEPETADDPKWKTIDIPYHDYIQQTMEQFRLGNFKQTLSRTQFILESYPTDVNALFYGGLCYYNLNELNQAIDAFNQVLANSFDNFDEEAMWYLANAYDLQHNKTKAREIFQVIVQQKGYYAKQAEKMLRK